VRSPAKNAKALYLRIERKHTARDQMYRAHLKSVPQYPIQEVQILFKIAGSCKNARWEKRKVIYFTYLLYQDLMFPRAQREPPAIGLLCCRSAHFPSRLSKQLPVSTVWSNNWQLYNTLGLTHVHVWCKTMLKGDQPSVIDRSLPLVAQSSVCLRHWLIYTLPEVLWN